MRKQLTPQERLIVAADFQPSSGGGRKEVKARVLALADSLKGTGVCIKINTILRATGYNLIDEIRARGLEVFADLKLVDIPETLTTDAMLLTEAQPALLTVMCQAGNAAMAALKAALPDLKAAMPGTEVLGVTVLTSLKDKDTQDMFSCDVGPGVERFAKLAAKAGLDGLISSAKEAEMLRGIVGDDMTLNTPAIRPVWSLVEGDDQNSDRIMTPTKAIQAGADRVVVGRPIVRADNPYDATMRTIDEIASACA